MIREKQGTTSSEFNSTNNVNYNTINGSPVKKNNLNLANPGASPLKTVKRGPGNAIDPQKDLTKPHKPGATGDRNSNIVIILKI